MSAHKKARGLQYFFIGFKADDDDDSKWKQPFLDATIDIFIHYNIQFNHLLPPEEIPFTWDIAMYKFAKDAVARIFNGLKKLTETKTLDKDILIKCFLNGKHRDDVLVCC